MAFHLFKWIVIASQWNLIDETENFDKILVKPYLCTLAYFVPLYKLYPYYLVGLVMTRILLDLCRVEASI